MVYLSWSLYVQRRGDDGKFHDRPIQQHTHRFKDWKAAEAFLLKFDESWPVASATIFRKEKNDRKRLESYVRENDQLKAVPLT
jgi:hypothetical protein